MKKILIIPHTYSNGGGAERVLNTLIGELSKWYDIDIIERWEDNTYVYNLPDNVHKLKSMTYFPHMVESMGWNSFYWSLHRKMLTVFTILFPTIVYRHYIKDIYDYEISFNYLYSALLIANSPNRTSKKIMWNHSDLYDLDYKRLKGISKWKSFIKYHVQTRAFKKGDCVVSISEFTYKSISDLFPFARNKQKLVFNGYNFEVFKDKSKEFEVKKSERFSLSFLGRLEGRKNVITAIMAVNRVIEKGGIDVELMILGDGECREDAEHEAGKNSDHFRFLGFQSNPYPYLKSSDALILTSTTEGFPTVIIEAISLGIPVITTKVGGVDEIIHDGENGLVVKNEVNDIADKIYYMATNYAKFTNRIEDTVSQFTAERWGENVKNLMESL